MVNFLLSLAITLHYKLPLAEDITFHLDVAKEYYDGKSISEVLKEIQIPYPPLFHYLLIPTYIFHTINWVLFLQIIFYPLSFLSIGLLVKKFLNWECAVITVLLLMSSLAYFDRNIQVTPQVLDTFVFPIAIYSFIRRNKIIFFLSIAMMFYSHAYYGLILYTTFIWYWVIKLKLMPDINNENYEHFEWYKKMDDWLFMIIIGSLLFVPVFFITKDAMFAKLHHATTTIERQQLALKTHPTFLVAYLGGTMIFIPLIILGYKRRRFDFNDDFQLIVLCWLASTLVLIPFYLERWFNYMIIPLAILESCYITSNNRLAKKVFIMLVVMSAAAMTSYYFYSTFTSSHHIQYEHLAKIIGAINGRI